MCVRRRGIRAPTRHVPWLRMRESVAHGGTLQCASIHSPWRGEGPVRLDDVCKDPRYGKSAPYHGMPKRHLPVYSYLAVPVISRSGEVLAVFTARDEELLVAVAAQAATAIDNARLYDAERRARTSAEQSQARTAQLNAITAALSRAVTADEAARIILEQTVRTMGAAAMKAS